VNPAKESSDEGEFFFFSVGPSFMSQETSRCHHDLCNPCYSLGKISLCWVGRFL
jgi:hypothetical protein